MSRRAEFADGYSPMGGIKAALSAAGPDRGSRIDALLEHRAAVEGLQDEHYTSLVDTAISVEQANRERERHV